MNFTELLAEVYGITNRPDLVTLTKSAVKAATLKAHTLDYFSKDIYETGILFPTAAYFQSLDYIGLYSNWRALRYLRRVTDENDQNGTFLEMIVPEDVVDQYGRNRTDIMYSAGRVIEIRSSVSFQYALIGAYVFPIVTDSGYSSWIADMHPYAIIFEACRVLFRAVGLLEESNSFQDLLEPKDPRAPPGEYARVRMTGLVDVGT